MRNIEVPQDYGNNITSLAISPDGSEMLVCPQGGKMILFIDMVTYNVFYTVETGDAPACPVYLADASKIFVPCQSGVVSVIRQIQPATFE